MRRNDLAGSLSLNGVWEFAFADGPWGTITVPGTWEAQGYLTRAEGPAYYRRTVTIPAAWEGRSIDLHFEAVSYHVEVRVNGQIVGEHQGMWTPFAFDVTHAVRFGAENVIELTVVKPGGERFPLRESLAGFLPDVAMPFGGVWQGVRLVAHVKYAITNLRIEADHKTGYVTVTAQIAYPDDGTGRVVRLNIVDRQGNPVTRMEKSLQDAVIWSLRILDPIAWSPDDPARYVVQVEIGSSEKPDDIVVSVSEAFGFRDLRAQGKQLLFNGVPVNLRGALSWGWYPDLLCPAPDANTIREEFRKVRDLGLNMVKLCLFVPSQTYFDIADEMGMFLWLEFPLWLPEMSPELRERAPDEYRAIMALAQHHPSVILVSLGCELGGDVDAAFVDTLADSVADSVAGMLLCDNSGSGEAYGAPATDASDFYDYHFYCDLHYFDPLVDYFRRDWREQRPWIFGEFCDADDYRNTDATRALYGGDLPWWLQEQNPIHAIEKIAYTQQDERMARLNLPYTQAELRTIAWQQSFMIRKTILEKVRARAGMGGYVLTSLKDNPLATSALFDDAMQPKYDAERFRQFNADSVLLLGQGRAREWVDGGDRPRRLDMFNRVGGAPIRYNSVLTHVGEQLMGGDLSWRVVDQDNMVIAADEWSLFDPVASGDLAALGVIECVLPAAQDPYQLTLWVEFASDALHIQNQWPIWVYPAITTWPAVGVFDPGGSLAGLDDLYATAQQLTADDSADWPEVVITSVITPALLDYVRNGGRVVLMQTADRPLPTRAVPFWREAIKLIGDHPVMRAFPHDGYADMQFYHLATDRALNTDRVLEQLPGAGTPVSLLGRLDARVFTWADYLVEIPVGAGTLIATTLRFMGGQGDQVSGLRDNIAGRFLLNTILNYLI